MSSKLNQPLKTVDLLSLLALSASVVILSGLILTRGLKDEDRSMGMSEAQNLAFQLVHGGFSAPANSGRQPASEKGGSVAPKDELGIFQGHGQIGKDPWGRSFQYSVIRGDEGRVDYVVVWSLGPNARADTQESAINRDFVSKKVLPFVGDDFGYVHRVKEMSQSAALLK